jgi:predicted dehydrogenase
VAVADPSHEARAAASRIARVEPAADAADVIARADVDAVVICAPPAVHAELAIAAARAGKAVYVEKPLALTLDDARAAVDALAASGRPAAVGFNHRFHPLHARARRLIRDGVLGRVRAVQTAFCEPVPGELMPAWKRSRPTGGGVLLDLGSHQVDLVRWLLGDEVESASAELRSEATEDDTAELLLETAGGASVQGFFSFRAGRCDWLRIAGDRGTLLVDRYAPRLQLARTRTDIGAVRRARWPGVLAPRPWQVRKALRPAWEPSYRLALHAFVDSAAGGRAVALPGPEDGLRSLEVLLAAEARRRLPSDPGAALAV